eukprot:scaffold6679_cov19-Prasinocladus_malaysianus.AAC.1
MPCTDNYERLTSPTESAGSSAHDYILSSYLIASANLDRISFQCHLYVGINATTEIFVTVRSSFASIGS